MKFIKLLLLIFSLNVALGNAIQPIHFKAGNKLPLAVEAFKSQHHSDSIGYIIIQFESIPDIEQFYNQTGIKLLDYLPNNSFYAFLPKSFNFNLLPSAVTGLLEITPDIKIDPASWNTQSTQIIKLHYFENANSGEVVKSLVAFGYDVVRINEVFHTIYIKNNQKDNAFLNIAEIYWAEFEHAPLLADNLPSTTNHRVNVVASISRSGKGLTGKGVKLGEWDAADVGKHDDYNRRLILVKKVGVHTHATHVAGTMAGAGNIDIYARGMAPEATIYSWDFNDDITLEMDTNYKKLGYTISQNSYTYDPAYDPCNIRGTYDITSEDLDKMVFKYPQLLHVFAAGNSRSSNCKSGGYKTIPTGFQAAKNVLDVAAVTEFDADGGFSCMGPTRDGRLKPEITAVGVNVYSTQPNNTYGGGWSGTSMACPGVSGSSALLYEYFKAKTGSFPEAHLAKNILCNSADEIGNIGPDYKYGYGRINMKRALVLVDSNRIAIDSIKHNKADFYNIKVPKGTYQVKIMLAWSDPSSAPSSYANLVNDLELRVTDSAGVNYLPWVLDTINYGALATRGRDSVNNIEQITINTPASGKMLIAVLGKRITNAFQRYSITWDFVNTGVEICYPNGLESFPPPFGNANAETIRWDAYNLTGNARLEYSLNNGLSWSTITTSVPITQKYFVWNNAPDTIHSSKALVRITLGTYSDKSDTVFHIYKMAGPFYPVICDSQVHLKWNKQAAAVKYQLYQMINGDMKVIYDGPDTAFTIRKLNNGVTYWFALTSLSNRGALSQRTMATGITPNALIIPPRITLNLKDTAGCKGGTIVLKTTVTGTGIINKTWYRSTDNGTTWNLLPAITDTLILSNLNVKRTGWMYKRVYSNVCEAPVNTVPAMVEVDTLPPTFTIPKDTIACFGGNITLKLYNIKSVSKPWVHWQSVCKSTGSTGTTKYSREPFLNLVDVTLPDGKNYPVSARNGCGSYCPNAGCCGTLLKVVPKVELQLPDWDSACLGQKYVLKPTISNGNPGLYQVKWQGPDTTATTQNLTITARKSGNYKVTVSDQGCSPISPVDSIQILVRQPLTLKVNSDTTICFGTSAQLSASASGGNSNFTYLWNNGIGSGASKTVSPLKTTTYYVTLTDSCSASILIDSVVVNVLPPLSLSATTASDTICIGQTTRLNVKPSGGKGANYIFNWSNGSRDSSTLVAPVLTNTFIVTVSDKCTNPTVSDTLKVNVRAPLSIKLTAKDTVCKNQAFTINTAAMGGNNASYSYKWTRFKTDKAIQIDTINQAVWEKVTLSDNCTSIPAMDSIRIETWKLPVIMAPKDTTLCYGQPNLIRWSIKEGRSGTYTAWWQFNKALFQTQSLSINPRIAGTLNYVAVVKDGCGYTGTDTTKITILPPLDLNPKEIQKCEARDSLMQFTVSGGLPQKQIKWSDGKSGVQRVFNNKVTNNYKVKITDACSDTALIEVKSVADNFGLNAFKVVKVYDKEVFIKASAPKQNSAWDFGDGQSINSNDTLIKNSYELYGTYVICRTQTDRIGCTNTICEEVKVIDVMANSGFEMQVAPNPNSGSFTLNFNKIPGNLSVQLIDRLGKVVYSKSDLNYLLTNYPVSTSNLSSGIYLLKVNANSEVFVRKVMIQ